MNCNASMAGCLTCGSASRCYTCEVGYYKRLWRCQTCTLSISSCCPFFIENCVTCLTTTTCKFCASQYYLTQAHLCAPCSNNPNCLTCANPTLCLTCTEGHFLDNYSINANTTASISSCLKCSVYLANCVTCYNQTTCLFCSLPFLAV